MTVVKRTAVLMLLEKFFFFGILHPIVGTTLNPQYIYLLFFIDDYVLVVNQLELCENLNPRKFAIVYRQNLYGINHFILFHIFF